VFTVRADRMSSTRPIILLLLVCAVPFAACKKKGTTAGGDAEPAGSAAPADSSSAAAPSGGEGGPTDDGAAAAATDAASEGGDQGIATDEGGAALDAALTPSPNGPTGGGGNTFTGNYNCMGGLTLSQTGNGVRGSAITRNGETVTNYDITCTVIGNECKGNASKFVSKGGRGPKSAGGSKVTFKLANGGLSYTEGGAGGFCTRK
jgi:hypothetical protein